MHQGNRWIVQFVRCQFSPPEISLEEMGGSTIFPGSRRKGLLWSGLSSFKQEPSSFVSGRNDFVFSPHLLYYFTLSRHKSPLQISHFSRSKRKLNWAALIVFLHFPPTALPMVFRNKASVSSYGENNKQKAGSSGTTGSLCSCCVIKKLEVAGPDPSAQHTSQEPLVHTS